MMDKATQYEIVVSHRSDLLTQDLMLSGIFNNTRFKDYGFSFDFPWIRYEHSTGDIFYPVKQIEELKEKTLSLSEYDRLVKFLDETSDVFKDYLNQFKFDVKQKDKDDRLVDEFFDKSLKMVGTIPYFAFEYGIHTELEKRGIPLSEIKSEITYTSAASEELKKLAEKHREEIEQRSSHSNVSAKVSKELLLDLNTFCQQYGYLGMIYFKGHPWTVSEAYKMLFDIDSSSSESKSEEGKYNSEPLAQIASKLMKIRTRKWELMCKATSLFRDFVIKNYSNEVYYESLLNLRVDEVKRLLRQEYFIDDVSNRKNFILKITESEVVLETGKAEASGKENTARDVDSIKGVIAQPGKIIGIAKVVMDPSDGSKVKKGDVLVTSMSTPDFLPAMMRAAAFVTDIGGITSHAAIVSREMKKPCIIGTKIATQVLKDGDEVEVDADRGIVTILKKADEKEI